MFARLFFRSVYGYLYIPFKKEELSEAFIKDIQNFVDGSDFQGKKFVVLYHEDCDLSSIPNNSKLYVLGHGINISPDRSWQSVVGDKDLPYDKLKHLKFQDWAYSVSGGQKAISINTVASRMKADGLLAANKPTVKLWFCDKKNKALAIAKMFLTNFKDHPGASFRLDYYPNRIIYSPSIRDKDMHKWARRKDKVVRASAIRESLFVGNHDKGSVKLKIATKPLPIRIPI